MQKIYQDNTGEFSPYQGWDVELVDIVALAGLLRLLFYSGHSEKAAKRRWLALCSLWLKGALERL
jgi:hypothetical protein